MKKDNKEVNRRTRIPLDSRTSNTAAPRRLDFGDMKEGQARTNGSSTASRRLAAGASEVAAEAPDHWRLVSDCGDILDHHQVTGPIDTNLMGLGPLPVRIII
jgi:hypothetical protein